VIAAGCRSVHPSPLRRHPETASYEEKAASHAGGDEVEELIFTLQDEQGS
jgi:hypothetical protein